MNNKRYFQQQEPKLKMEAWLKALLCGLSVGSGALFIAAFATWFAPFNGVWLSLGVFISATIIATLIFYQKRFFPSVMQNARRLDGLGLEERLVTMVEFEDNESYITELQRKDAREALAKLDNSLLKIKIPTRIIATCIACFVIGAGMVTVNLLSSFGILPDGNEMLENVNPTPVEYVTVSYVIEEGGILEGDEDQIIVKGTNATLVTAVADDGYMFKEWSDGFAEPTRHDLKVTEDVVYTAVFVEMGDEGDGDGDGDGDGEQGDEPQDAPSESNQNQNNGDSNTPNDPNNNYQQGAGGAYQPNNQIIDGETYYREVLESYKDSADERIQNEDSGYSDEDIEIIKKYLGIV